jgi:hypothetical protein
MPAFWIVLSVILLLSSLLNARQVVIVDDLETRLVRAALSLVILTAAFLSLRKGLADMGRWPPSDMNATRRRRSG